MKSRDIYCCWSKFNHIYHATYFIALYGDKGKMLNLKKKKNGIKERPLVWDYIPSGDNIYCTLFGLVFTLWYINHFLLLFFFFFSCWVLANSLKRSKDEFGHNGFILSS